MKFRLIAALLLSLLPQLAAAQTPNFYVLKDQAGSTFNVGVFNCPTGKICPLSVSSDSLGNPLSGTIGATNPNGTALYMQGVTGGVPVPSAITGTLPGFASPPTVNLGTIGGAATQATLASILSSLGSPFQAGGTISNTSFGISGTLPAFAAVPHFICDSGCAGGGGGGTSSTFGAAFPATGTALGVSNGANMVALTLGQAVSGSSVPVVLPAAQITALTPPTSVGISGTLPGYAATPTFNIGTAPTIAVTGTFFQGTQPISAAALPLPTGASTAALQTSGNSSLSSIDTKTPALGQALAAASVPVVLTAAQLTSLTPLTSVTVTQGTGANLHVVCDSGCAGSGGTSSTIGAAYPTVATAVGMSQGGNMVAMTGTSGSLNVNITGGAGSGGTASNFGSAFPTAGTALGLTNGTNMVAWSAASAYGTSPGAIAVPAVNASITNTVATTLTSTTITGTVAVTQSGTWNVTNISGTISLPTGAGTSANQTAIQAPVAAATATATKSVLIGAQFLTTQPTITTTQQASLLTTSRGELLVSPGVSGFPVTLTSTTITGTVAATQSGTWNIGSITTLPALVAGSAIIGNVRVDQTTPGTTNGVVVNSSSLPTGAATAANQSTEITSLATIATNTGAAIPAGSAIIGNVRIDQTTAGTTNGVVVNSSALPTGAGTAANQATIITALATLNTTAGSALAAGSAIIGKVGIDQTTPGTTNGVQDASTGATGSAAPSKAGFAGAVSGGNLVGIIQADTSAPINISTATTTQLVALSSGKKIYVTALDILAAGTGNVTLEYGTGTNCATGTTILAGAYNLTAQAGLTKGSGLGPVLIIPASNALCALTSAAVQMSGSVAYTQF